MQRAVVVLLLAVALGGCVESDDKPAPAYQPDAISSNSESGGSSQRPAPDGSAPGSNATQPGQGAGRNGTAGDNATVGSTSDTQQNLPAPYMTIAKWKGTVDCAVGTPTIVVNGCYYTTNDHFRLFNISANVGGIVAVLRYTKELATNMDLQMHAETERHEHLETAGGPSPVVLVVPAKAHASLAEAKLRMEVWPDWNTGAIVEQEFEMTVCAFYHGGIPDAWDPVVECD